MKPLTAAREPIGFAVRIVVVQPRRRKRVNQALVIIDIQNDYFPGGKMVLEGSPEASGNARLILEEARRRGLPVYHIQHVSVRPDAAFFIAESHGVEIHENVRPLPGETVIQKHYPNSFRQTSLLNALQTANVSQVIIAGMMTHMCVDATTRAAFDLGFQCTLVHDACATRSLSFGESHVSAQHVHLAFVSALHGLYADARTASDVVRSL